MERTQKAEAIKDIKSRFDRMSSAVFLDFTGMTVEEVSKLRDKFREKGIEYKVVKNKLVEQALTEHAWSKGLKPILRGMTGVAWSFEEPSAAARIVKDFVKDNEKLKVKAGLLEGQVLDAKDARERRHHFARLVAEKMLHHLRNFAGWWSLVGHGKRLDRRACELPLAEDFARVCHHRAFLRDWAHLDRTAVGEWRTSLGDLDRFVQAVSHDQRIAADRFLGLRERSVRHRATTLAGNGPALSHQRLAALHNAFFRQVVEPRLDRAHALLEFLGREFLIPIAAATKQQQIFLFFDIHVFLW